MMSVVGIRIHTKRKKKKKKKKKKKHNNNNNSNNNNNNNNNNIIIPNNPCTYSVVGLPVCKYTYIIFFNDSR